MSRRKLGNELKFPRLRIEANKNKCTSCKACTRACPMGIRVNDMVKSGKIEHSECIMCGCLRVKSD